MGLLDGDIATIVDGALSGILLDVTVTQVVEGSYTPGTGVTNTETEYSGKGFVEEDVQRYIDTGMLNGGTRVITLTQGSLSITPAKGDKVTIRGTESVVQDVAQDPAAATWVLGVTP
jgi:hypothetical protein